MTKHRLTCIIKKRTMWHHRFESICMFHLIWWWKWCQLKIHYITLHVPATPLASSFLTSLRALLKFPVAGVGIQEDGHCGGVTHKLHHFHHLATDGWMDICEPQWEKVSYGIFKYWKYITLLSLKDKISGKEIRFWAVLGQEQDLQVVWNSADPEQPLCQMTQRLIWVFTVL